MKKYVVDKLMAVVIRDTKYDEIKLSEIRYGLEAIYVIISRFTIYFAINALIGNFVTGLLFFVFFGPIKSVSYGFHAKNSLMCFIISATAFIAFPYLSHYLYFNIYTKLILIFIFIVFFILLSPADTPKKPIVSNDLRKKLKLYSMIIVLFYSTLILTIPQISTIIILVLTYQCLMLNPLTYEIFKTPYNNYLYYKVVK